MTYYKVVTVVSTEDGQRTLTSMSACRTELNLIYAEGVKTTAKIGGCFVFDSYMEAKKYVGPYELWECECEEEIRVPDNLICIWPLEKLENPHIAHARQAGIYLVLEAIQKLWELGHTDMSISSEVALWPVPPATRCFKHVTLTNRIH